MSKLFQPVQVGRLTLEHRIVLTPMTRTRANDRQVPSPFAAVYYSQRASTPGTLLITEATLISPEAGGYTYVPGIWSDEQIAEWKKVTDAVHAKGSYIYAQLWALGRGAWGFFMGGGAQADLVSASDIPNKGGPVPRPLTKEEINDYVQMYVTAALNAVERAGFDGVEIHNANGYLLDQFLQTNSNNRTDEYGGSVENRSRFTLEVLDAITGAIGQDRTAIRFSPWSEFQDMRMPNDADVHETFSYIVSRIRDEYPNLAYINLIEPRMWANSTVVPTSARPELESNDFIHDIWAPRPLIRAGNFNRQSAIEHADKTGNLIAFGRYFVSNPDLPRRLKEDIPLAPYDRDTFYMQGDQTEKGYTDYPFAN